VSKYEIIEFGIFLRRSDDKTFNMLDKQ